jgi:hypothetical protein
MNTAKTLIPADPLQVNFLKERFVEFRHFGIAFSLSNFASSLYASEHQTLQWLKL